MGVVDHYVVAASESSRLLAVTRTQSYRGAGFFAWEPEWTPGVGWAPGEGNPNEQHDHVRLGRQSLPPCRLPPIAALTTSTPLATARAGRSPCRWRITNKQDARSGYSDPVRG